MTDRLITRDRIYDDRTVIHQYRDGYRFSVDALLLAWFAFRHAGRDCRRALEMGAGSGVVAIVLKRRGLPGKIECIERAPDLYALLAENIVLNGHREELTPVLGDIRLLKFTPEVYDLVFFNPPYHPPAAGRTSPDEQKAAARHELTGSLVDFLRVGATTLKKKGRLCFVYPAERGAHAYALIAAAGLTPRETIAVREHPDTDPALLLFGCVRGTPEKGRQRFGLLTMRTEKGLPTVEGEEVLHAPDRRAKIQNNDQ